MFDDDGEVCLHQNKLADFGNLESSNSNPILLLAFILGRAKRVSKDEGGVTIFCEILRGSSPRALRVLTMKDGRFRAMPIISHPRACGGQDFLTLRYWPDKSGSPQQVRG